MNMVEKYGASVDEAVRLALLDLHTTVDKVKVTVLQEPVKGFFGIGSKLARVRVEIVYDLEHLDEDGQLPWGWYGANKEFTDKIHSEWMFFLNRWIESRNAHPTEQYGALKSILQYAYDVQKLCSQKGECFSLWCSQTLIGSEWIEMREAELADLEASMDAKIKGIKYRT